MSKIRIDKRYSALATYQWYRQAGFSRREAWAVALDWYGW